jgi:hypothetical protein
LIWINLLQGLSRADVTAICCGPMLAVAVLQECISLQAPKGTPMFKISLLIWIILGTALAGTAVIAVLAVPSLAAQAMKNIPFAVLAGFAAAMPLSYLVARKIGASTAR